MKPLLDAHGLSKRFGATQALNAVRLRLDRGELLGLVGGNGAGKSTLLKVLTGVYRPDEGGVIFNDKEYAPTSPFDALRNGMALIPQELRVVPAMSVADNLVLGQWPTRIAGLVADRAAAEHAARAWLGDLGLDIDPARPIGELSFAERQSVVIARAMARNAKLLILDEPTASLGQAECDRLFALIERLKGLGSSFIYVSHRLDEVETLCDRVVVMRDGSTVAEYRRNEYRIADLVDAISGGRIREHNLETLPPRGEALLRAAHSGRNRTGTVTVEKHGITGMHGLLGSGIEHFLRSLFGAHGKTAIEVRDGAVEIESPASAIRRGIGYVPSERHLGIVPDLSVRDNIALPHLDRFTRGATLRAAAIDRAVAPLIERLDIRPPDPSLPAGTLSGGNQQKVLFARWLLGTTHSLLLDEPTHGVDVAAKALIKSKIREFAAAGGGVLVHSVELDDLADLVDELFLVCDGDLSDRIDRPDGGYDIIALEQMT